jgi:hypothetical protein
MSIGGISEIPRLLSDIEANLPDCKCLIYLFIFIYLLPVNNITITLKNICQTALQFVGRFIYLISKQAHRPDEELDGPAVSALRRAIAEVKQRWSVIGWVTKYLHLQSLAPTNPHWARVVGYGPFSLCVIHKEGLWPSSVGIDRLMMMMMKFIAV